MKESIHPKYHERVVVQCACGNKIETGSTRETVATELCSACHPFYTGVQKLVDTAGRVDKYRAKVKKAEDKKKIPVETMEVKVAFEPIQEKIEKMPEIPLAPLKEKKPTKKAANAVQKKPAKKTAKPVKSSAKPAKKTAKKSPSKSSKKR